ncbi:MAG: UDP-N-acetylmuramoyl-L-alanine--D-glutamate ligase [Nitrospirae bacterium]|nr:UDP-N-acetylmuramoyl-L-alanine--D-glutamate ligase [Nitrospirota bacterium]
MRSRNVVIVGLGRSGIAAARLLHFLGADVTVTDARERDALSDAVKELPADVGIETGGHPARLLDDADTVVVSPGVPLDQPFFDLAGKRGIEVIGELELAFRILSPYGIPWVAITGTNGKSTTTTLVHMILARGGQRVIAGGNIGTPITEEVLGVVRDGGAGDLDRVVVEVSSFQLESTRDFAPSVASILNISPDHLDRYDDIGDYIRAKTRIFRNQTPGDSLVLNLDDPVVRDLGGRARSELFYFSTEERPRGAYIRDGRLCIGIDGSEIGIVGVRDLRIRGAHNTENALAALLVSYLCGVDVAAIREVLSEFKGLEHRMEFVAEIEGVEFYNDSKGTNIGSVVKSLEGFRQGVILILGGRDKGSDFTTLRKYMTGRVKGLVVIGEARQKILGQLGGIAEACEAGDMKDAVTTAFSMAEAGDVVLLSPGCASFDMFESFEHRGAMFKESVMRLRNTLVVR